MDVNEFLCATGCEYNECVFGTLLAVEVLWRLSCDLLLANEDLQLRSLCLCLHSRQFLTATQHTKGNKEKTGKHDDIYGHLQLPLDPCSWPNNVLQIIKVNR